ncbi:endonuclease/exonuclease/phosphatase family metal-dependent hydrolase [Yimella lutea]|uniref:Endonuclease/exonuclease/phosphatase family metal-dependent hydrolase n=1 Tax=Yimella lutea TaxID=587872 RepID=A0A542EBZ2_9MICO|nr:endonuclease/exonuclease/phosphatase family protein [Yimella lutea]TQJ12848.1 endonuclease/exonuclease/phosphatase family metal-dependent hydrolase [Yimella lutea]
MAPRTSRRATKAQAAVGLLATAVMSIRWWDLPAVEFLAMCQALWPVSASACVVTAAVLGVRRRGAWVLVLGPALALSLVGVGHDLWRGAPLVPDEPGKSITVAAINMKQAQGSPDDVAAVVKRHRVDVLVLLEVDEVAVADLRRRPELRELRYTSGRAWNSTVAGSVILSRLPQRERESDAGPASPGQLQQPRVVISGSDGRCVAVLGAHPLPPLPGLAGTWAREIKGLHLTESGERDRGCRTVVAGDFNATRDHPAFRAFLRGGVEAQKGWGTDASWPSASPVLSLDHVVTHGFAVSGRGRFTVQGSDHRGTWVRLVPR